MLMILIRLFTLRLIIIASFTGVLLYSNLVQAGNASYILLSNTIARKTQLNVVANNAANSTTNGYIADMVSFDKVNLKQNAKRKNSFVRASGIYRDSKNGGIRITHNPTDLAIEGKGYFKILTPRGPRYTLDGSFHFDYDGVLVNHQGYPCSSIDSAVIQVEGNYDQLNIAHDGTISVNNAVIDRVGVFNFQDHVFLKKEGDNLYMSSGPEIIIDNYTIQSGALKMSNVNSTKVMVDMVELQRSYGTSTKLMSDLSDLERNTISKMSLHK
ncbi:MAG: flagellar hook basal-body protein [Rickettsiaceae bacterium]|nr:flagellar hook basal-body protein [Rickettsiaceae bacterium]